MFKVIYADEARQQLLGLDRLSQKKIFKAIETFKDLGRNAKNSKPLDGELWEIKADNVRAYFVYEKDKIIIVGLVVLKKSQKAPKRFMEQALKNIEKVRKELNTEKYI